MLSTNKNLLSVLDNKVKWKPELGLKTEYFISKPFTPNGDFSELMNVRNDIVPKLGERFINSLYLSNGQFGLYTMSEDIFIFCNSMLELDPAYVSGTGLLHNILKGKESLENLRRYTDRTRNIECGVISNWLHVLEKYNDRWHRGMGVEICPLITMKLYAFPDKRVLQKNSLVGKKADGVAFQLMPKLASEMRSFKGKHEAFHRYVFSLLPSRR